MDYIMISVILPAYNNAAYINYSVKSILSQTFKNFELLIVDDGSFDNSEEVINSFKDTRIVYVKRKHEGLAETLNFGLQKASFDWVARMDADDICLPSWLENELAIFKKYNGKKIISCQRAFFEKNKIKYIINDKLNSDLIKKKLLLHSFISHPGVMYNKNIILTNGGYRGNVYEDYDLWLRLRNKVSFYIVPKVLIFMRIRKDSLSSKNYSKNRKIHYAIQEPYYKSSLKDFGINTKNEENEYKGWREYFYGDMKSARNYWRKMGFGVFNSPRIIAAFFISFLPDKIINKFKKLMLRYRIRYLLNYFSRESRSVRKSFNLLNS